MPRNDEGEFELVLGNRQLLSGFFIVVILFGVFFTMGYIVGRASSPATLTTASTTAPPAASVEAVPARAASTESPLPGHAEVVAAEPIRGETPPPETGTRPATAPAEAPTRIAPNRAVNAGTSDPPPGRYLQVAAPRRTAADGVVESLRNKGIVAVLAPGPNEDIVRVLVGPLDAANIGKMRVDLESAGFKPILKNY